MQTEDARDALVTAKRGALPNASVVVRLRAAAEGPGKCTRLAQGMLTGGRIGPPRSGRVRHSSAVPERPDVAAAFDAQ